MKNISRVWFVLLLIFSTQLRAQIQNENSIFWEISGKGIQKPSYIFGTHHLHSPKFIEKNERIETALKSIDWVVGEIVIDSNQLNMAMKLTMMMLMKDNTISNLMKKEDYEATDKCLREYLGMGIGLFNNFKPIFIYHLLMVAKYQKANPSQENASSAKVFGGNPLDNSMDGYFQQRARALKAHIRGLETVDEQLKILYEGYTLERQIEMLLDMVYDKSGTSGNDVLELSNLYIKQDLQSLLTLMQKSTSEEELKQLLVNRNNKWIPQIDEILKSGKSAFIAVGAGHLPGDFGVVSQLRKKGYTLKPISILVE
jgi:uncharacterized protein YbaP (TraB family)